MGHPINEDGTLAYDRPASTPTCLTDSAEEYTAPSEAAMEVAKDVIVTIQESYGMEYKSGEPISDDDWRFWASTLDRFAAKAVAAERARLAVAISRAFYALPSSNGHEIKGQEQMCIAAINLVKAE